MSGIIAAAGIGAAGLIGSSLIGSGGGGGGGGGQTYQNQTQTQQLPQWVQDASIANYQQAVGVANTLMGPYPGYTTAPVRNEAVDIYGTAYNNFNAYGPNGPDVYGAYNTAMSGANALMGYQPQQVSTAPISWSNVSATPASWSSVASTPVSWSNVSSQPITWSDVDPGSVTARQLAGTNLDPYMNPFTQRIIDPTMKMYDEQRRLAANQISDRDIQTGSAFGSRGEITRAVSDEQYNMNSALTAANLYSQNFLNAQNMATADINREFDASRFNTDIDFRGQVANQANAMAGNQFNSSQDLRAQMANQATGLQGSTVNANNALQAALANQSTESRTSMFNSDSALRAALANQSTGLAGGQFNAGLSQRDQQLNQAAGLAGAGLNLNAAQLMGSLGTNLQNNFLNMGQFAAAGQADLRGYNQQLLDQEKAYYEGQRNLELQRLQIQQAALTNSPYPMTTTTQGTGYQPQGQSNGLMTGLGGLTALAGVAGSLSPYFRSTTPYGATAPGSGWIA